MDKEYIYKDVLGSIALIANPLTLTDPSGFSFFSSAWKHARHALSNAWRAIKPYAQTIAVVALATVCQYCAAALNAAWTVANGGTLMQGLVAGVSAFAYSPIDSGMAAMQIAGTLLANGITGGVLSVLSDGKFGAGFLSAGVGSAFGMLRGVNIYERVTLAAVGGGTTSVLSGGKFANGAINGAFAAAVREAARYDIDKNGDPVPENISDKVTKKYWANRVQMGSNGEFTLDLTASYSDYINPIDREIVESYIQDAVNGWAEHGIKLNITLVDPGTHAAANADMILESCGTECGTHAGMNRGKFIFVQDGHAGGSTAMHEVGHWLGLEHQSNSTNSIMSYSSNGRITNDDASRIKSCYFNNACGR